MTGRVIAHVDMDAFFAAVEVRDNPQLRDKPVLVGGAERRGVVAAANYMARSYGCHSAQPMAVALRKCPHAVVCPPRFEAYAEASRLVFEVFERFSPAVEGLSIDEAFLDLTGTARLLGRPEDVAQAIKRDVHEITDGLTCSVGLSAVKFVAKMASGHRKPDGLTVIAPGEEAAFLRDQAIEQLWGVGEKTAAVLRARGVRTIGALANVNVAHARHWLGSHGEGLHQLAHGIDPRDVVPSRPRKQISVEDTYNVDRTGRDALARELLRQAQCVADRLAASQQLGTTLHIKLRTADFTTVTRQKQLVSPTRDHRTLFAAAQTLLDACDVEGHAYRLTGLGVTIAPSSPATQLDLFAHAQPEAELQDVMSDIRTRFGSQALFAASTGPRARRT